MIPLDLAKPGEPLTVLCLGAHSDDIEIGAGGTILKWIADGVRLTVHWWVLSADGARACEATASAEGFLAGAAHGHLALGSFKDGFFPYQGEAIKEWLLERRRAVSPDIVFTHRGGDSHQDHRLLQEVTWNLFRDQLVLEYEIPKWDGDTATPNLYVPLPAAVLARKVALLNEHFGTQRSKDWFDEETFRGLARLRGMECRAPERYAEAFTARKLRLG